MAGVLLSRVNIARRLPVARKVVGAMHNSMMNLMSMPLIIRLMIATGMALVASARLHAHAMMVTTPIEA